MALSETARGEPEERRRREERPIEAEGTRDVVCPACPSRRQEDLADDSMLRREIWVSKVAKPEQT